MHTKQHITALKNLFPAINSILEIQCGDGYDIENCLVLQNKEINYIGVDVRDEKIFDNRQYFRDEKNKIFMVLDASNEPLPKSDLVVCVGMAPYLPIANIWSLLENIRDSQGTAFAFDYYTSTEEMNADIELPEGEVDKNYKPKKRPINLCEAPFYFPKPRLLIPTDDPNHFVAFYEINQVSFYMDWHNDDVSKLRKDLVHSIEKDIAVLLPSFLIEENGEELFKEMMIRFLDTEPGNHNQKYYYDAPYNTIINRVNGLQNRNNIFRLVYRSEPELLAKEENYKFITSNNAIHAQVLAKDYIRWKFGLSLWID